MLLTTYKKYHTLPVKEIKITINKEIKITINNKTLENVKQQKLLSIVVDQNLSWNQHFDKVHKTVSMLLASFTHVKPFLPTNACIKFCKAFIFPHFEYCSTVWGSAILDRLYKLLKRVVRMIFDHSTRTPHYPPK